MRTFFSLAVALLAVYTPSSYSQIKQYGAWHVGIMDGNEGLYAATVNESNGALGQYCVRQDGQCVWLLLSDVNCDEGHKYPILVNSDAGASNMELLCKKLGQKPRYAFTSFESIDNIVRNSSHVGFAFPMANGYFTVSRFSLNGAANAVTYMRGLTKSFGNSTPPRGTRDTRL